MHTQSLPSVSLLFFFPPRRIAADSQPSVILALRWRQSTPSTPAGMFNNGREVINSSCARRIHTIFFCCYLRSAASSPAWQLHAHSPCRRIVFFHGRRRREPSKVEPSISIRIQKRVYSTYVHKAPAIGTGASGSLESRGRQAGAGGAGPGCRPVAPLGDAREA